VKFAAAYGHFIKSQSKEKNCKIVVGRDARISGPMMQQLVMNTLTSMGIDVVDVGLSTTPTVEMAVPAENAQGGIILTASHNPKQWNALKLLNEKGEFLSGDDGKQILRFAEDPSLEFAEVDDLGVITENNTYINWHIEQILNSKWVDVEAVKKAKLKVVVDAVNSTGGIAIPRLLKKMGVEVVELYCTPNGDFPHNPEPLKENLTEISALVKKENADMGIVVDPDVDRLAIIDENGEMIGEEYTIVAAADYVLSRQKGNTVSNLSSSRALRDITEKHGGSYSASAVGEVNVVEKMKATNALFGGEGNGGVIFPDFHYGRDSLVGSALILSLIAQRKQSVSELRSGYTDYYMSKNKIQLTPEINVDEILAEMEKRYASEEISTIDGVKIDFPENWVHLRKSNTEPIIRVYTEAKSPEKADELAQRIMKEIDGIIG
jgi:phosphomannomutase